MEQQYIQILEKTNQQLGLWTNPYSFLVSSLSVLVGFLAITFAFMLWQQSREYKKLLKQAIDEYKLALTEKINEINNESKEKIQVIINEHKTELESIKKVSKETTKESREKIKLIETKIEDLEKQKDLIGGRVSLASLNNQGNMIFAGPTGPSGIGIGGSIVGLGGQTMFGTKSQFCPKCGSYINSPLSLTTLSPNYCGNCGCKL